ncbi:MAG: DUF3320 domain-containing protein [Methanobrevibacter sp.]|jgi:superfamily I DNA and/or RNA helicase|nr:DUF3320 domain-containing protein [Candidatus Methanovirga basalitermitum]
MRKDVKKEFKDLRRNLLDLTSRNPLLNFKQKSKSIEVVNSTPSNIYQFLITQHKKMYFISNSKDHEKQSKSILSNITEPIKEAFEPISEPFKEFNKSLQNDASLKTDLSPRELQKRLFYINQLSKTMIQEKGYNVLYLAVGFLEWSDKYKPMDIKKAPLALIPVVLERKSVGKSFSVYWNGEDVKTNISLQAKLKEDDLILPDFQMQNSADAINHYFISVKKGLSNGGNGILSSWKINNDIALGFFSFTKFVMYKDLNPKVDLSKHNLIDAIFNPDPNKDIESFDSENIDKKLSYNDLYNVLDADSSQIAVIEDVKAGRNLVVEGPPGTGKSQTIVNLISELIGSGKSILFVSEKMAALEVVKSRLDSVGLGKFVLQLHSHRASRKNLLNEIKKGLNRRDMDENFDIEQIIRKLELLRYQLDEYVEVLHKKNYSINMSPFELYGMKEMANDHFSKKSMMIPLVSIKSPENVTKKDLDDMIIDLENLAELHHTIGKKNSWNTCSPDSLLPGDLREIQQLLIDSENHLNEFITFEKNVNKSFGIKISDNLGVFNDIKKSLDLFHDENVKLIDMTILKDSPWINDDGYGLDLIRKLDEYQKSSVVWNKFYTSIENEDVDLLIDEFKKYNNKGVLRFFKKNKSIKEKILSFYKDKYKGTNDKNILEDLQDINRFFKTKKVLNSLEVNGRKYFGNLWYLNVDISQLNAFVSWIDSFNKFLKEGIYNEVTIERLSDNLNVSNYWEFDEYIEAGERLYNSLEKLKSKLNPNISLIFKNRFENVPFDKWKNQLNKWNNDLSRLHMWSQYLNTKNTCLKTPAKIFIKVIEDKNLKNEDIKSLVYGNFADGLLQLIFAENQYLSSFVGDLHENKIKNFRELDLKIMELNRKRIYYKLNNKIPEIFGNTAEKESKILASELTRKRGHIPLRTLFKKTGSLIKQIKPCFMMSPLSIAEFLDPTNHDLKFDVVVFDEASQVKPEDAFGAFMRAKTAVVIGDTQQLPPTSFFDQMISAESDEEIATALDMESILHLCKLSFPVRMLKWHYRSRHESLINVSNKEFYDGELLVYPSPTHSNQELGLKFKYNPKNYYQRGKNSNNIGQATEVVDEIFKHFKKYGAKKSLGVGTFSVSQRNAILEELEVRRKEHPELEHLFSEKKKDRFFVKNLETIQGDERDVMLISIGYGFDENGSLSSNFGPLNQDGGERRLNVLITRGKEKCVVFSNFKAYDMHLGSNTPFGVEALRNFLEYAENMSKDLIRYDEDTNQENFVDSVYSFLKEKEFNVHKNVGDFFKIDLAILDDEDPGRYILGIECDGENYKSSKVARDRDRLRDQVLTGLNWNLYHLWSTDWYRNRNFAQSKLIQSITKFKKEVQIKKKEKLKEDVQIKDETIIRKGKYTIKEENSSLLVDENSLENNGIEFIDDSPSTEVGYGIDSSKSNENEYNMPSSEETNVEIKDFLDNETREWEEDNTNFKNIDKNLKNSKNMADETISLDMDFSEEANENNIFNLDKIDLYKEKVDSNNENDLIKNNLDNKSNSEPNLKEKISLNENKEAFESEIKLKRSLNAIDDEKYPNSKANNNFNSMNDDSNKNSDSMNSEDYIESFISTFDDNGIKNHREVEISNPESENSKENYKSNIQDRTSIVEDYDDNEDLIDISNPLSKDAVIKYSDDDVFNVLSGIKNEIKYIKKSLKQIEAPSQENFPVIDRTETSKKNRIEEDNHYINRKIDYRNLIDRDLGLDLSNENDSNNNLSYNNLNTISHDNAFYETSDEFLEEIINRINHHLSLEREMKQIDDTIIPKNPENTTNVEPYKTTNLNINKTLGEFYKLPDKEINHIINKIVLVEGPIHTKEMVQRIKEGLGISRATSKFKNKINKSIKNSENRGLIFIDGDFLFSTKEDTTKVRKRNKPNIDMISNIEIEENIHLIFKHNNGLKDKDLIKQVAKNFGFKTISKKTNLKISHVIDYLTIKGTLLNENNILHWINF